VILQVTGERGAPCGTRDYNTVAVVVWWWGLFPGMILQVRGAWSGGITVVCTKDYSPGGEGGGRGGLGGGGGFPWHDLACKGMILQARGRWVGLVLQYE